MRRHSGGGGGVLSVVIADSQPQPVVKDVPPFSGLVTENFLNFAGEIATASLPA